ncbi:MAG: hypothetical protein JWR50_386 [Mucilaginibacter sp.]|nr:hypothetical protein [Mucilaginibacter sp.]
MIIKTQNTSIKDLAQKIITGITESSRRLVEKAAANNESLIVGDNVDGFKEVPAKELLKTMPKK